MASSDYSDLPLAELIALNDPATYGWGEVLRNTATMSGGILYLPSFPNETRRWDCLIGAIKVYEMLNDRGITAKVVSGEDSGGFFMNHTWVELADGRQLDPTPLYSFTGTTHSKRMEATTPKLNLAKEKGFITIPNQSGVPFAVTQKAEGRTYLSSFGFQTRGRYFVQELQIIRHITEFSEERLSHKTVYRFPYLNSHQKDTFPKLFNCPEDDFLEEAVWKGSAIKTVNKSCAKQRIRNGNVPGKEPVDRSFEEIVEEQAALFSAWAKNVVTATVMNHFLNEEEWE